MLDLTTYLITLADKLDKEENTVCADAVDNLLLKTASLEKLAQYVGVIGYVLKQNRAMGNCIRKKRVASDSSMQDVVLSCLKEYQDGQDYNDTKWTSKYADTLSRRPDLFKTSHLTLLHDLGQSWEIDKHLNNVRTASQILKDNNVDEERVNTILSHIETLGKMLQKETNKYPFKFAAPLRNWWSRLWNPGEKDTWSPKTWGRNSRENKWGGDDTDLEIEIDNVLHKIMNMSNIVSHMTSNINRLKRKAQNARVIPKYKKVTQLIFDAIEGMDINDWSSTEKSIFNMATAVRKKGDFSHPLMTSAVALVQELDKSRVGIDNSIDEIRKTMESIRTRGAMTGKRGIGTRQQVQQIAAEFEMLDRVIDKIDQNPMDKQGYYYAQTVINRLNDSLQNKDTPDVPSDDSTHGNINKWINPEPSATSVPSATVPASGAIPTPGAPAVPKVSDLRIKEISDAIKAKMDISKAREILTALATTPGLEGYSDIFLDIATRLGEIKEREESELSVKPPVEATPVVPESSVPPPSVPSVPSVEPPAPEVALSPVPVAPATPKKRKRRDGKPEGYKTSPEIPITGKSLDAFVKLADILDPIDSKLADAIDYYLKNYKI